MKTAQINQTNAMIRNLYFRLKNSERLIRLYRDQLLPQAARAMEIAETWFREKQGSFSDFVETEAVYYNFQLSLARAKADYGKYLAQIERLCGVSLTRKMENAGRKEPGGAGAMKKAIFSALGPRNDDDHSRLHRIPGAYKKLGRIRADPLLSGLRQARSSQADSSTSGGSGF